MATVLVAIVRDKALLCLSGPSWYLRCIVRDAKGIVTALVATATARPDARSFLISESLVRADRSRTVFIFLHVVRAADVLYFHEPLHLLRYAKRNASLHNIRCKVQSCCRRDCGTAVDYVLWSNACALLPDLTQLYAYTAVISDWTQK